MSRTSVDCLVLGGGPAGSTAAGILKKYAPDARVLLLEAERFPRWRIGESTIPVANTVFRDLGVYDELQRSDAVKKIGIVFIWGQDRTPWSADYLSLRAGEVADAIDVLGQDFGAFAKGQSSGQPISAFNVQRAWFDQLLLQRAEQWGAVVRQGTRATGVMRDGAGRVTGVTWEDDQGGRGQVDAGFVIDASGLSSLLTRGQRERDPRMNNFAVHGYLKGARWKVEYNGTREYTTVFIASVSKGWLWYFPVGEDVMSVGFVTHRDHFKDRLRDVTLEELFWENLRDCPELGGAVSGAELRDDVLPGGARVAASQDWSSWARSPVGPGWAAAGDAAVFVDPILSSGVTLAVQSGHRAAYTWLTARAEPRDEGALWDAYASYVRGEAAAFLRLARYFYGNNRAAPSWWWEAQALVNADGHLRLDDRQAFTMATAGFFPSLHAIGREVVGPLLRGISGTQADVMNVFRERGLPTGEALLNANVEHVASFRLAPRSEPPRGPSRGRLRLFYDLVTEDPSLQHRLGAVPTRFEASLAPLVSAAARCSSVRELVEQAPALLEGVAVSPEAARAAASTVLAIAACKGFVRLHPRA